MLKVACEQHIFQGVSLPNREPMVSHLFYSDDMAFTGDWSESNFINLNRILRCFYIAFSLDVFIRIMWLSSVIGRSQTLLIFIKSKVFGVGVEYPELSRLANILCCEPNIFPFTYLV